MNFTIANFWQAFKKHWSSACIKTLGANHRALHRSQWGMSSLPLSTMATWQMAWCGAARPNLVAASTRLISHNSQREKKELRFQGSKEGLTGTDSSGTLDRWKFYIFYVWFSHDLWKIRVVEKLVSHGEPIGKQIISKHKTFSWNIDGSQTGLPVWRISNSREPGAEVQWPWCCAIGCLWSWNIETLVCQHKVTVVAKECLNAEAAWVAEEIQRGGRPRMRMIKETCKMSHNPFWTFGWKGKEKGLSKENWHRNI